jgi:hypothetical protein
MGGFGEFLASKWRLNANFALKTANFASKTAKKTSVYAIDKKKEIYI